MTLHSVRSLLREFVCDIVIFLYKIGEALLDATIRPYILKAVCSDVYEDPSQAGNLFWRLARMAGDQQAAGHAVYNNNTLSDVSVCLNLDQVPEIQAEVQRDAAGIVVAHRILVNIPAVILGLFCGAWSDSRGRKLPMMAPSAGSCLAVVLYMTSTQVNHVKVPLLLAGAAIQGIFGKASVIAMAVNSHVSDTSDREQRTRRLGRLLASSFLGMFLGSLMAGLLQDMSNLFTTLTVVSGFHAICVLAVLLGVTETVCPDDVDEEDLVISGSGVKKYTADNDDEEDEDEEEKEEEGDGLKKKKKGKRRNTPALFSVAGLKESLAAVVKKRDGNKRGVIIITLLALTLNQCLKVGDQDVTVLFVQEPPLSWPSSRYGYLNAVDYGTMGLTLIFILPLLSDTLHASDISIAMIAMVFKLIRSVWAGFCTDMWMVFTSVVSGALGGLINPALRSVLSKTAKSGEIGKLFSIQASLETLSKLVGSSVFTGIYAATVNVLPAAAYLAEAALYVCVLGLLLWLGQLVKEDGILSLLWNFSAPYKSLTGGEETEALPSIRTEDVDQKVKHKPIFPLGASTP